MSQDRFTDLLNQCSEDAEGDKIAEAKRARRRVIFRRIRKVFLYAAFAASCWAAYQYRDAIQTEVAAVRQVSPHKHVDKATGARVADLSDEATQREALMEETFR